MLLFDVQRHVLERLLLTAVDFAEDNFRTGNRHFETFTTHVFDKNGQVQFTTARNAECVCIRSFFNAQRHVVHQLFIQAVKDLTRGNVLTFFTAERRGVNAEEHGNGRLIDRQRRQRFNILRIADGVRDVQLAQTGDRDDIARFSDVALDTLQTQVGQNFTDFTITGFAFAINDSDLLVRLHFTALDAADADDANVVVVVQLGDLHLQRAIKVNVRCRYAIDDSLIQRSHILSHIFVIQTRNTVQRGSVNDREVQLFVGSIKVNEQVEYLIDNPVRARARTVNFVDNNNRLQTVGKSFLGDEARLRHRTIKGINHQQHRIYHGHDTFNFTTEVGVPRGINDVDTVIIPFDSSVFSEDGNPTLFLQIVGVHHSFLCFSTRVERTRLL